MHRKKHKRRRRHVGAFKMGGKDTGLKLIAVAGGFFLGNTINSQIDKLLPKETAPAGSTTPSITPTKNAKMLATAGEIGIGGLLLLRRGGRGTMGTATKVAGGVLAGAGLRRALNVLGIMSGFQSVPVIGRHRMAGFQNTPVIGATPVIPAQLAGTPPQLAGYRPAGSGVGAYVSQGSGVMGSIGCCDGGSGSGLTHTYGSGYMN